MEVAENVEHNSVMKCTLYFQNLTFSSELYIYLNGTAEMNNFFLWVMFYSFSHVIDLKEYHKKVTRDGVYVFSPDRSIAKEVS